MKQKEGGSNREINMRRDQAEVEESGVHACDKMRTRPNRSAEEIPLSRERLALRPSPKDGAQLYMVI